MVYLSISLNHLQFPLSTFYSSQHISLSPSLVRFIPKYFVLFDAILKGIVFLPSLSDISLLVKRNATDFCMLFLHPATLLNSLSFLVVFVWSPYIGFYIYICMYIVSCHLHITTILPLPYQSGYFFFFLSNYRG